MPDLNYGYEVTIVQNATSNPPALVITNQWQRQVFGSATWENIDGATNETYEIADEDHSAKIRLQQDLDGAKAYSNELQVTDSNPLPPPPPQPLPPGIEVGANQGVFHIRNIREGVVRVSGSSKVYNMNGTLMSTTGGVFYDGELLIVSNSYKLFSDSTGEWDFGELTDTSNLKQMSYMFFNARYFNYDIGNWNTSNATNMSRMFESTWVFNQNLSNWNTSNATTMNRIFANATAFNQSLSGWDTSNVTNMVAAFKDANVFNQNISNWNTSNVTHMQEMFYNAFAFNQDLSSWDTSNVVNMGSVFRSAESFNQDIGGWNTSNVTNMRRLFYYATVFGQDLSLWCVSKISEKPSSFDSYSAFGGNRGLQPQWGTCPRGEDQN